MVLLLFLAIFTVAATLHAWKTFQRLLDICNV